MWNSRKVRIKTKIRIKTKKEPGVDQVDYEGDGDESSY